MLEIVENNYKLILKESEALNRRTLLKIPECLDAMNIATFKRIQSN